MLSVLGNAAWAEWGRKPDSEFSQSELKSVANADHDSEAMQKLQEGFDAMSGACRIVQRMFTEARQHGLLGENNGSIPSLMTAALKTINWKMGPVRQCQTSCLNQISKRCLCPISRICWARQAHRWPHFSRRPMSCTYCSKAQSMIGGCLMELCFTVVCNC